MPIIGITDAEDEIFAKKFGEEVFKSFKKREYGIKCRACNQRLGDHRYNGECPDEYVETGNEYIRNWKRVDTSSVKVDTSSMKEDIEEMRDMISKLEAT